MSFCFVAMNCIYGFLSASRGRRSSSVFDISVLLQNQTGAKPHGRRVCGKLSHLCLAVMWLLKKTSSLRRRLSFCVNRWSSEHLQWIIRRSLKDPSVLIVQLSYTDDETPEYLLRFEADSETCTGHMTRSLKQKKRVQMFTVAVVWPHGGVRRRSCWYFGPDPLRRSGEVLSAVWWSLFDLHSVWGV